MHCARATLSSVACPALQNLSALSHKRHDFRGKKVIGNKMCVLIFCSQLLYETFHIIRNFERVDLKKNKDIVFTYSTRYSYQNLTKLEFSQRSFVKYSNVNFHENTSRGRRVPCGRIDETEKRDESRSRSSQFCESV